MQFTVAIFLIANIYHELPGFTRPLDYFKRFKTGSINYRTDNLMCL